MRLKNKVALITGASRKIGIGQAIARQFAAEGADLCLTYYHPYDAEQPWGSVPQEVEALHAELTTMGRQVLCINADLADIQTPSHLFAQIIAHFGKVDILVNNAAYSVDCDIDHLTPALLDAHYAVNVRGMMLLCAEFVRHWQAASGGRILNLTSGQGLMPMPGNLAYVATKGAVDAFTMSLSAEVMARGITVNAIDPGATDTGWMSSELEAQLTQQAPLGRVGLPEDAARLITFLASDEAQWLTGQIIRSRGGL